jgi:hypothetical protein
MILRSERFALAGPMVVVLIRKFSSLEGRIRSAA